MKKIKHTCDYKPCQGCWEEGRQSERERIIEKIANIPFELDELKIVNKILEIIEEKSNE